MVSPVAANRSRPSGLAYATERNGPSTLISPTKPASVRVSSESTADRQPTATATTASRSSTTTATIATEARSTGG